MPAATGPSPLRRGPIRPRWPSTPEQQWTASSLNEGAATMTAIAIIGQGYMGRTHSKAWSNLGYGDQIKYVCTPRPGQPLEHAPRAEFVTDLAVVLADRDVDIISVCTPVS